MSAISDRAKSEHAKNAIFLWYAFAVANLLFGIVRINLLGTAIYWILGVFIASFCSALTFYIQERTKFTSYFWLFDIIWIITISYLTCQLLQLLFGS
jgi:tryptophan-rich sensory protein